LQNCPLSTQPKQQEYKMKSTISPRERQQRRAFVIERIIEIRRDKTKSDARALLEIKDYRKELKWLTKK
jgi:hypothetical protein